MQANAGRSGFMVSDFPYGYVESVNVDDDKDCEQGILRVGEFSRISGRIDHDHRIRFLLWRDTYPREMKVPPAQPDSKNPSDSSRVSSLMRSTIPVGGRGAV